MELNAQPPHLNLTHEEQRDRHRLERQVERAFYLAGVALTELRDRRLYRSTHSSFEQYCQDRFGFSRRRGDYLIGSSKVVDNLKPEPNQNQEPLVLILPTSERQCRPLIKLEPPLQRQAWQKSVKIAKGKVPSGKIVSQVVSEMCSNRTQLKTGQRIKIKAEHSLLGGYSGKIDRVNKKEAIVTLDKGKTVGISQKYIELELSSDIKPLPEEGVAYTVGMRLEYNVRLSQETWDKLNAYAKEVGTASLDGAIARLLESKPY